jgi:stress-induced-phosphoprotein 1
MYIDPVKAEEHNELAKGHFKSGDFVKAMKDYEEAIKRNPKDPKLYSNKGICLMKLMDFSNALIMLKKCLELDPQNTKAYAKQGNCYFAMKEYNNALVSFEKGLKIDANNVECKEGMNKT